MDKEIIEKFDKEQLDILLNDLQDIDKFTGFKDGTFKYELGKYQANLLINCIKKQKEVIDKAIEWVRDWTQVKNDWFEEDSKPSELLDILKEATNNE